MFIVQSSNFSLNSTCSNCFGVLSCCRQWLTFPLWNHSLPPPVYHDTLIRRSIKFRKHALPVYTSFLPVPAHECWVIMLCSHLIQSGWPCSCLDPSTSGCGVISSQPPSLPAPFTPICGWASIPAFWSCRLRLSQLQLCPENASPWLPFCSEIQCLVLKQCVSYLGRCQVGFLQIWW